MQVGAVLVYSQYVHKRRLAMQRAIAAAISRCQQGFRVQIVQNVENTAKPSISRGV
jgi:hypothetical protein